MADNHTRPRACHAERAAGDATVVEAHGEIDILTTPSLAELLDTLSAGPCPDLVLDLSAISFIDCSGLRLLCRTRTRTLARHGRLRLVTDSTCVLRILRDTRLTGAFEIHPDLSAALAAVPPGDIAAVTG
ncbi:STAS domain-containing protein [Streptomyces sp. SAS_270]|uniref:STAS domain-containing protein n=1 Tax=Streptomyces sp. SAS_270 TaxID=3412748 RepID=UPI00403D0E02